MIIWEYDEDEEDGDYHDNIPAELISSFNNFKSSASPWSYSWSLASSTQWEWSTCVRRWLSSEDGREKDFLTLTPQWINLNHYYELWTIIVNRSISSSPFWRRTSACCPPCTPSVNWKTNRFCHYYYCDGHREGQQMLSTMSTKYESEFESSEASWYHCSHFLGYELFTLFQLCEAEPGCRVISIAIHYFFTVCFMFMFLEAIHM